MMGQLTNNKADLALYPLTLTAQRARYIKHTQPFQDGGYGMLVRTQEVNTGEPGNSSIKQSTDCPAASYMLV
jgi:hypothetical protein